MVARRRKPRLFSFSREVEMGLFEETVTAPDDRRALGELIEAFLEICRAQAVTPETLAPVERAARHPSPSVRGVGITRLAVLAHYFDDAVAVLERITRDESEEIRLYACAALANTPDTVAAPLVTRALEDESWRVRKSAAQAAGAVEAAHLVPILARRLQREQDARVRVVLQLAIDFQRHAQRISPAPAPSATPGGTAQLRGAENAAEQTEEVRLPADRRGDGRQDTPNHAPEQPRDQDRERNRGK
jgi:hypothetical protein